MKALIPAAGLGTRFLPATKSIPKEMLPENGSVDAMDVLAKRCVTACGGRLRAEFDRLL